MNWSLVVDGTVRYTLLYGGASVGAVALATRSQLVSLLLAAVGSVLVLFALGRNAGANHATIASNAESVGFAGSVIDPGDPEAGYGGSLKLFFYGIGLVVFGGVALVALGGLS